MSYQFNRELFLPILRDGSVESENFVDIYGNVFDVDSFPALPGTSEVFDTATISSFTDRFRAAEIEWGAFALAIQLVKDGKVAPTICELGSSQGLWCAPWSRILSDAKVSNTYALAIEASPTVHETKHFWNLQNLSFKERAISNGVTLSNEYMKFDWLNYAVSYFDGVVEFPDILVSKNNGAAIGNAMNHEGVSLISVNTITPNQIINRVVDNTGSESVGLVQADLQGEELNLLHNDALDGLISNTSIIVLGSHSKRSDEEFPLFFEKAGMVKIQSQPGEYLEDGTLIVDGEQVWIKKDLFDYAIEKQYVLSS